MAKQMHGALQMVEHNNSQLLERKLQLQFELAEVSEALESLCIARRELAGATSSFVEEIEECLEQPLRSHVLELIGHAHQAARDFIDAGLGEKDAASAAEVLGRAVVA